MEIHASRLAYSLGLVLAATAALPAAAQTAPAENERDTSDLAVGEIVVTAQRSAQNLQDVPIAVSAIQAADLSSFKVTSTKDIDQLVPGLTMNRKSNAVQPFIRGIGSSTSAAGVESPVATYVDGIYIPTPHGATFDLPDVERIEVLKGPQGTLFGRNATSGAINVVTRTPSNRPELEMELGYANYDTIEAKAYAAMPLGDVASASLSFYINDQRDGWGDVLSPNGTGDSRKGRVIATRGKVVLNVSDNATLTAGGHFMQNRGDLTGFTARPNFLHQVPASLTGSASGKTFVNPGYYNSTRTTDYQGNKISHYGGYLTAEVALGNIDLINTTAYQKLDADYTYTPIYGGIPFDNDPVLTAAFTDKTFTNELRAQYSGDAGERLMVGVFYLDEKLDYSQYIFVTKFPPYLAGAHDAVKTTSKAAFADGTYPIGGGFSLTGGIRYTKDKRSLPIIENYSAATGTFISFPSRSLKTSKWTYRVVGQWEASDDVMFYVSQSKGYKAGFFNLGTAAPTAPALEPEELISREIGAKTELFNRRVRLNVAAYWNSYDNVVVQQTRTIDGLTSTFQTNAAKARTRGVEAEISTRVTPQLTLSGGVSYMYKANYLEYDGAQISNYNPNTGAVTTVIGSAAGNRLIQAPKFEAQAQALYSIDTSFGNVALATNLAHRSRIYLLADNQLSQSPVTIVNASAKLTLPGDRFSVSVWGKNLFDEAYLTDATNSSGVYISVPGSPQTYGVTFGLDF